MIETFYRISCDGCGVPYVDEPQLDQEEDGVRLMLLVMEQDGWKVYRLARDIYYGKAWCKRCREDRCKRCDGRGYYPKWPLDPYYGEPAKIDCEVCDGRGF